MAMGIFSLVERPALEQDLGAGRDALLDDRRHLIELRTADLGAEVGVG